MEGRLTGTAGHRKAVDYAARNLRSYGIIDSRIVPVPLRKFKRDWSAANVILRHSESDGALQPIEDFFIGTSPTQESCAVSGQAVFVGFGISARDYGVADFDDVDLEGKIAIFLSGAPVGLPPEIAAIMESEKLNRLSGTGAAGYLRIYSDAGIKRFPYGRLKAAREFEALAWVDANGHAQTTFGSIACSATLSPDAAEALFGDTQYTYEELKAMAREGVRQLPGFPLPIEVEITANNRMSSATSDNLLGIIPGADANLANEAIVLLAHLDHLGISGGAGSQDIFNGAYDNAFGAAIMLEVARNLSMSKNRPRRTIIVAFVTGEEQGLIGSDYLASNFPEGFVPVAAINLDMPLIFEGLRDVVFSGAALSTLGQRARLVADEMGIPTRKDPDPEAALFVRSDHYRFHARGVPSIFVLAGPESRGPEGSRFLDERYHRTTDDLSQPFDFDAAAEMSILIETIARRLANDDDRPSFTPKGESEYP